VTPPGTHARRYLYTTDLSLSEEVEEAWRMRWEIEELHRDVKALGLEDSSFWRRERLQGYLTIFTIMTNVVSCGRAEPERGGVPQVR